MPRMLMLAAHHTQNSSIGAPWRSDSGMGSIPWVSMLQPRSLAPPQRPWHPLGGRLSPPTVRGVNEDGRGTLRAEGNRGVEQIEDRRGSGAVRPVRVPQLDRDAPGARGDR